MKTLRVIVSAAVLCGGALALSGCHSQVNEVGGVPMPAPNSPSAQVQMQDVDKNPHIPDAQKVAIKANIANSSGVAASQPPAQKP